MARTLFRVVLGAIGVVALTAGTGTLLFGDAIIPGAGRIDPSVDSELRFYAVWYAAAGIVALGTLRKVESATTTVRFVAAAFFVGGCARIISIFVVGRPHPLFIVLMVIELVLPPVLILLHSATARAESQPNV